MISTSYGHLEQTQLIKEKIETVFEFFSDPRNLNAITPPWLHFETISLLPLSVKPNTIIEHRLKLRKIPVQWKTQIAEWSPPHNFTDIQASGPFAHWEHRHIFEDSGSLTKMSDIVRYQVPGGPFAKIVDALYVRPELIKIFKYRSQVMATIFETA